MTIADTPNGFEVRDDVGRVVFGPASEVEAERFTLDAVWSRVAGVCPHGNVKGRCDRGGSACSVLG